MAKKRPAGRMRPSRLFLRPLSSKYMIHHSQLPLRKFDFLKPKYNIFDKHFRNFLRFSQICRQIFKIVLNPSTPLFICLMFVMNLRP